MPNASVEDAAKRAVEWRMSFVSRKFKFNVNSVPVKFSIGVATYPVHASTREGLLQAADQALYYSKQHETGVAIPSNESK